MTIIDSSLHNGPGNIHMIHLDNNSWSPLYDFNIKSWKRLYPDCDFKLWGWKDVIPFFEDSKWCTRWYKIFQEEKLPWALAMLSDYLRLYILNKFGGLYIDTDVFAVNRLPSKMFRESNIILAWDPGIRSTGYESDYTKDYKIEKTGYSPFWREYVKPVINNGSFFFSRPNISYLQTEMNLRDERALTAKSVDELKTPCLTLSQTILEDKGITLNNYQKLISKDRILILNSNLNAFEPEEMYFDYNKKYPIYCVHQCMCTGYLDVGERHNIKIVNLRDIFKELMNADFKDRIIYMIPINENWEEFNEVSYCLRKFLGPVFKFNKFVIKPMPIIQ